MPDGFEPVGELERIHTFIDFKIGCRQRLPQIFRILDESLQDEDKYVRISAAKWIAEQAFGKARQQVEHTGVVAQEVRRVQIGLPDNGRSAMVEGPVIDAEA